MTAPYKLTLEILILSSTHLSCKICNAAEMWNQVPENPSVSCLVCVLHSLDCVDPLGAGLTHRLVAARGVLGTDGGAAATGGGWRRLTQRQGVFHVAVLVYGLPFITATQERRDGQV